MTPGAGRHQGEPEQEQPRNLHLTSAWAPGCAVFVARAQGQAGRRGGERFLSLPCRETVINYIIRLCVFRRRSCECVWSEESELAVFVVLREWSRAGH